MTLAAVFVAGPARIIEVREVREVRGLRNDPQPMSANISGT